MGKRNTVKVDINEMFLPNAMMDNETVRKDAIQSPVWPIAVAIYAATDKRVRVSDFISPNNWGTALDHKHKMCLSTTHGFPVANVYYDPTPKEERSEDATTFTVQATYNLFMDRAFGLGGSTLHTNSQRYAVQKMFKGSHDVYNEIVTTVLTIERTFSDIIRTIIDNSMDSVYGGSLVGRPSQPIPREYSHAVMKVLMGDMDKNAIPFNVMDKIKTLYESMKQHDERFDKALNTMRLMFEGEKIVFIPGVRNGVVVGKTNTLPVMAALDTYEKGDRLPYADSFAYMPEVGFTLPLKWYKSMQDLPEELRRELEIQLVMLKSHIGCDNLIPTPADMADKRFWPEIGAMCRVSSVTLPYAPVFLLNSMSAA
jgi:hypothetical protein